MTDYNKIIELIKTKAPEVAASIVIIFLSWIASKVIMNVFSSFTKNQMRKAAHSGDKEKEKKVKTAMTMARSVARYIVNFILLIIILYRLGFGEVLGNALYTAGISSIIISFGVQNIIKDVFTGIILRFENQFSVGDYVKINGYVGTVRSIAMRVTYLDIKGKKVIIPNGDITEVVNYSTSNYSLFELKIPTPYEENTEKMINILKEILHQYYIDHKDIFIEEPAVTGIYEFEENSVVIYMSGKVTLMDQWPTERELRFLVKKKFDELGIKFPYPHVQLVNQDYQSQQQDNKS